jgi:hypothetical protein
MYYECVCLYSYLVIPSTNSIYYGLYCTYYLLLLARLYHMFLIRGKIFSKKCNEHKVYVLIFYRTFVRNISYSKNNSAIYYHKCTQTIKLEFLDSFSKKLNIKFHENPSNGSKGVPSRERDRQTDMAKLIVFFAILRTHLKWATFGSL